MFVVMTYTCKYRQHYKNVVILGNFIISHRKYRNIEITGCLSVYMSAKISLTAAIIVLIFRIVSYWSFMMYGTPIPPHKKKSFIISWRVIIGWNGEPSKARVEVKMLTTENLLILLYSVINWWCLSFSHQQSIFYCFFTFAFAIYVYV